MPLIGATGPVTKQLNQLIDLAFGVGDRAARIHNEVGATALFFVRHLARDQLFQLLRRHTRAGEHALRLDCGRRADDGNSVNQLVEACFIKQRDLEDDERGI